MDPKHSAIVAGLALSLAFGSVALPCAAFADDTTGGAATEATDIDKGLFTQQTLAGAMRSVQGISLVNVSDEMKYFTKYESHGNYNQGFSYGDGYNALGYYQFDRRWSLVPFMTQGYNYNPVKYGMLKAAIDCGSQIKDSSVPMYANGQLTDVGRIAQDAFQGAYAADPAEFSALQDSYAYNSYYAVTESWLRSSLGIDISGRADCVKGTVWSITNMCGTGGCQDFFRWANLSNSMSDREFVTALASSVVNNVAKKYPQQSQYHKGWQNRYRNELADCLVYISEDEDAAKPAEPDPAPSEDGAGSADGSATGSETGGSSNASGVAGSNASDSDSAASDNMPSGSNASSDGAAGAGDPASGSNADSGNSDSNGSSSSANDAAQGSGDAGQDDVAPGDDAVNGSLDSESNDGAVDSDQGSNDTSASDDKSAGEKLGEAVGSTLTAGLSKSESDASVSDPASDKETKSEDDFKKGDQSDKQSSDKGSDDKKADGDKKSDEPAKDSSSTTTITTTTSSKKTSGGMPSTGDVVIMASLASASLATFGMTAIVSGKNKLKRQNPVDKSEPSDSNMGD